MVLTFCGLTLGPRRTPPSSGEDEAPEAADPRMEVQELEKF